MAGADEQDRNASGSGNRLRLPDLTGLPGPFLSLGGAAVSAPFLLAEGAAGSYLPGHPFILVLPAILAASVLFRWQGGLTALAASALYVDMFLMPPVGALSIGSPAGAISFIVFVGIGLYVVAVISSLQSAMGRLGRLLREVETARDRSAAAEREKAVLIDELDHRIRNAIASVASVVRQTLRGASDLDDFGKAFDERIAALVRTHELIARDVSGAGTALRDILDVEFAPFGGGVPCELVGPDVPLGPQSALKMSLVFHELATNAAKYGGLSADGLGLKVSWDREADGSLSVDWRERVSKPRPPSTRRGSGSRLLDHTVRGAGGSVSTDPDPLGHAIAIRLPPDAMAA
jgi:two-component sensor histidine kinase